MGLVKDISGEKFGNLTVLKRDGYKGTAAAWMCKCDCGNVKTVSGDCLRRGLVISCGCLRNKSKVTHGGSSDPEYAIWRSMRARCSNSSDPAYPDYGGRGISVCSRWDSYLNFITDMGRRPSAQHSIERTNNNGNYEPGNCRWATRLEQARNRRNSVTVVIDGRETTLSELSEETGVKYATLYKRHVRNG